MKCSRKFCGMHISTTKQSEDFQKLTYTTTITNIYLYLWQRANDEQIADAAHKLFSNYLYIDYNQLEIGLFPRSKGSLEIHGTYVIYFKYVILIMVS